MADDVILPPDDAAAAGEDRRPADAAPAIDNDAAAVKGDGSVAGEEASAAAVPADVVAPEAGEMPRVPQLDEATLRRDYPYRWYGAHVESGKTSFRVYAPEATHVSLLREGNDWGRRHEELHRRDDGVWTITVDDDLRWQQYKYRIRNDRGYLPHPYDSSRIDPFSRQLSLYHGSGGSRVYNSIVPNPDPYPWTKRHAPRGPRPMSIYELHLGAFWSGNYRAIGEKIAQHVGYLGFTHVQIMPPFQTPIHESWGYLVGCPYAINERYGSVDDFRWMVNHLHEHDIGVVVDVPLGFGVQDWDCGLSNYDGSELYHHVGPRGWNNQWQTRVYNLSNPYVRDYLCGICTYLHDELGIDGARIDAVSAMLFFDYDRGEWDWPRNDRERVSWEDWELFNGIGGDMLLDRGYWISEATDFESLRFLRDFHLRLKHTSPAFFTIAEESRRVFKRLAVPVEHGGLGFTYAQNMGEMHRVRRYLSLPVEQRRVEEIEKILYAHADEQFVNAMNTHDECANGRTRLVTELGNHLQLIGLAALCWFRAGAPMVFMGDEFCEEGYFDVWRMLEWSKTGPGAKMHEQQMTANIHDLNRLLRTEPALALHNTPSMQRLGSNNEMKYYSFIRWAPPEPYDPRHNLIFVRSEAPFALNRKAEVHVPVPGNYRVIYNSVDERYIGRQGYNEHDPYWSYDTGGGTILWLDLLPHQNMVLKLEG